MVFVESKKSELIGLRDVAMFRGKKCIFEHVNISVFDHECIGLLGPNGSGKSTLLRGIVGFETLKGEIVFNGRRTSFCREELVALRRKIGLVHQGLHLWPYRTVLQNITEGLRFGQGMSKEEADEQGLYWLKHLQVEQYAKKFPTELSGGEQQRVAMARALVLKPSVLLLDEPTSGLDPLTSGEIAELLIRLKTETGLTLIIVSHQIDFIRRIADRAYFLHSGTIRETGAAKQMLAKPETRELADFIAQIRLGW